MNSSRIILQREQCQLRLSQLHPPKRWRWQEENLQLKSEVAEQWYGCAVILEKSLWWVLENKHMLDSNGHDH